MVDNGSQRCIIGFVHDVNQKKPMDTNETNNEKITTSIRLDSPLCLAIDEIAKADDRPSRANMIERLLKTHPRIQPILEAEPATAAAGN